MRLKAALIVSLALAQAIHAQSNPAEAKARRVVAQAIEAMGGETFSKVREIRTEGRYFFFKEGRSSGLIRYLDYTRIPDKSRFQLGLGKNAEIYIYDLAAGKGWVQEGKTNIKELGEAEVKQFRRSIKHALELVFRTRYKDPDVRLFYFGSEEISAGEDLEAVELLDSENDSTIVYFDKKTHLPTRVEYTTFDKLGLKHKEAAEYSNWQTIAGVRVPFNVETTVDGEKSSQSFVEKIAFNVGLPDSLFQKPVPEK